MAELIPKDNLPVAKKSRRGGDRRSKEFRNAKTSLRPSTSIAPNSLATAPIEVNNRAPWIPEVQILKTPCKTPFMSTSEDYSEFVRFDVRGDGHCFARSLSLLLYGSEERYTQIRLDMYNFFIQNFDSRHDWNMGFGLPQSSAREEMKKTLFDEAHISPTSGDAWIRSDIGGQLAALTFGHIVVTPTQAYSEIFLPINRPINTWKRPLFICMPNAHHFNALMPPPNPTKPLPVPPVLFGSQSQKFGKYGYPHFLVANRDEIERKVSSFGFSFVNGYFYS